MRLWPFVVALGVAAAVAAVVAVVAASSSGLDDPAGSPEPLAILVAAPVEAGVVRAVTVDGCYEVLHADVRVREDATELRVIGRDAPGGCAASSQYDCHEVRLPAEAAGKRLVAIPLLARDAGVSDESLARQYAAGDCPRLRLG